MSEKGETTQHSLHRPKDLKRLMKSMPQVKLCRAQYLYDLITKQRLSNGLHLGFRNGITSAYLAGALRDVSPRGHLAAIDERDAKAIKPGIHEALKRTRLSSAVTVYFEDVPYTWRLMKILERGGHGQFDFCYLDGKHTWEQTGFALSLVTLLLRPGGWIILDHLNWTIAGSPSHRNASESLKVPEDVRITPAVRKVYDLIVRCDPRFSNATEDGRWGIAQRSYLAPATDSMANLFDVHFGSGL
jgi:predicted O-methyltransferase YrrM